jgi:hypothetical protein
MSKLSICSNVSRDGGLRGGNWGDAVMSRGPTAGTIKPRSFHAQRAGEDGAPLVITIPVWIFFFLFSAVTSLHLYLCLHDVCYVSASGYGFHRCVDGFFCLMKSFEKICNKKAFYLDPENHIILIIAWCRLEFFLSRSVTLSSSHCVDWLQLTRATYAYVHSIQYSS